MDYLELKYTVACLEFILPGATIHRFYQLDHRSIAFTLQPKHPDRTRHFLLVFDGRTPYLGLYLSNQTPKKETCSELSRSFEKKIGGSEILSIQTPYPDRIVVLECRLAEWPAHRKIWFEFLGSRSNVTIVDEKDGKILDCLLKIPDASSRHPLRMPGRVFEGIYEQTRIRTNPLPMLTRLPEKWPDTKNIQELSAVFLNDWVPMTPKFSKELAQIKVSNGVLAAIEKIHAFLLQANHAPKSYEQAITHLTTLSKIRENQIDKDTFHRAKQRIQKIVNRALKRIDTMKRNLTEDFQKLDDHKSLQKKADLLAINFHRLQKGMEEIRVCDILDTDSTDITIELNTDKSPKENLDAWYRKAAKVKRARPIISARLDSLQNEIDNLQNLLENIEHAENLEHLSDLANILAKAGFPTDPVDATPLKAMLTRRPYHRFVSVEGVDIWVGRNAMENSMLSFKDANPHDFWLHVKDYHGAHVILKNPGKCSEPSAPSLEYAAQLAAYYSKARGEKNVPVMYTQRKHIRPASGKKLGRVIVKHHKTISVNSFVPYQHDSNPPLA